MLASFLNFVKRPFVGDQTTAREAYQQSQGYARAGYTGNGGFHTLRTIAATQPAGIAPGPTHKVNDPTVTGNNAGVIGVHQLSDGPQF